MTGEERRSPRDEPRWRQVLEVAQEAYVAIGPEGRVVDWNRRAETLFGWTREQAVGMPAAALVAPAQRDVVPFLERLTASGPDDLRQCVDLPAVDRCGRAFAAQCTVWGVDRRAGTVVHLFVQDVTDRRRAEQAGAFLTAVVEGTADAIITRDLQGTILSWNAGAERIYGWTAHEAVGRADSLIVPPDKAAELDEMVRLLCRGQRVPSIETERVTRGGTRVPVALTLSPVRDAQGQLMATSAIARDVTEQRWMAETLDTTLHALQAAADEARESEIASRRFLDDAAHQLRTPMAGIRACAETLLRGVTAQDADRLLTLLVRETSRAGGLISSLLRVARLDQGVALQQEWVDVVALCAEEVGRLDLLSPTLHVCLEVARPPSGPYCLDRGACREVLSNLGDNAVRHAVTSVVVQVEAGTQEVRIRMVDDGPGVPPGAEETVFDRFVTLDGSGGSGLGLTIGRALARRMGGDLVYDGAFLVTLPAAGPPLSPGPG